MSPVGMDDRQLSVVEKEVLGEHFASAEARFEYEKARRLRRVAMVVGGLLALVAFGAFMYRLGGGGQVTGTPAGTAGHGTGADSKSLDVKPVGSPQAKVQVLAIVPAGSDCHSGIIKFLAETAEKQTDKIRVEFTTMEAYGQDKLSQKVGSVCAAVLINGQSQFTVTCEGKERSVSLVGTEPTHYSLVDVGEALTSVYVKEYGDPGKPIFEAPPGSTCGGVGSTCNGPEGTAKSATGDGAPEPLELPGFKEMKPAP